jgi:prepilin-type N-terminal cleavage/methylation domain-containing protein/prepilin-type processing-associated H-X9-DG protein
MRLSFNKPRSSRDAFTLVELMVVISIITLLVALLLPALAVVQTQAREVKCTTTLRGMIQATHGYAADCDGALPAGVPSPFYGPQASGGNYMISRPSRGGSYFTGPVTAPRLAHVGYLMYRDYLPAHKDSFTCPQTDFRTDGGYNSVNSPPLMRATWNGVAGSIEQISYIRAFIPASSDWYLARAVSGSTNLTSSYNIRGTPQGMKIHDLQRWDIAGIAAAYPRITVQDAKYAFFFDREAAVSTITAVRPRNPAGPTVSPLPFWGRVHVKGINTAYMDGHVEMFADESRAITYYGGNSNVPAYGNAEYSPCYDKP